MFNISGLCYCVIGWLVSGLVLLAHSRISNCSRAYRYTFGMGEFLPLD